MDEEDYLELNEEEKNAKEPRNSISLDKKVKRASQTSKQKNHKNSGKAGRVPQKIYGEQ